MKRLAIFLITIFTMFSCEDFYKDNGCIEMYEGNTETSCKVYFYNGSTKWDNVYVYSWDSDSSENNGGWPGERMTYNGNEWYQATISYSNVIFSSSSQEQTENLIFNKDYPYFMPSFVDEESNKIGCYRNYSGGDVPYLTNYTYYFYNGNLDWNSVNISISIDTGVVVKIIDKEMTYYGNNWYRIETIYPIVCFSGNSPSGHNANTEMVFGDSFDYFVPDESYDSYNGIPVSGYYSMPDF